MTPLGIFVTLLAALVTTEPKTKFMFISGDRWSTIMILVALAALYFLVRYSITAWKLRKEVDIVEEIKKGCYRLEMDGNTVLLTPPNDSLPLGEEK